ncbi:hypothetical protein BDU57DRAFT_447768 [Ampelomyces quisqualis]|uniref:Uncharacterized protein n=1 Tax=Ampelomyces quisqualis TaxID=50730 RepID=A0A6A5QMT4_AMPQU|nr:hypothetical protein BDU57DRAFT_447768 [Ampelomyces quisqualis]
MPTTTPFLDILPPEIRLRIYTSLLTSSIPIKGPWSRRFQQEKYNIHTAILRTNKQIHSEARHVFFGRNTFTINALPPLPLLPQDNNEEEDVGSGAFEPPLQLQDLNIVRHLEIDLLYYPTRIPIQGIRKRQGGGEMKCIGAQRYVASLSHVLSASSELLKSLKLVADVRPHIGDFARTLDMKKYLMGLQAADDSTRFKAALGALTIANITLRFDFSDMVFEFETRREVAKRASLVYLAGQVVIKRGEIEMKGVLEDLGEKKEHGSVDVGRVIVDWVC